MGVGAGGVIAEYPATLKVNPRKSWIRDYVSIVLLRLFILSHCNNKA